MVKENRSRCFSAPSSTRPVDLVSESKEILWRVLAHFRREQWESFVEDLKSCWHSMSLWFALPFSIWLSCGWLGLLLHWQAISGFIQDSGIEKEAQPAPFVRALSEPLPGDS